MELDPKEVLFHLNEMGYKNITATQLKNFMKDLKKLIKYETNKCNKGNKSFQDCMKTLTAGAIKDPTIQSKASKEYKKVETTTSRISRGISTDHNNVQDNDVQGKQTQASHFNKENIPRPCSRASKASTETKTFTITDETTQKPDERVKMWIRTSRPKSMTQRNDPVELYHKYKKEWEKYKQQIPGENDHSELRWRVRTKLLG